MMDMDVLITGENAINTFRGTRFKKNLTTFFIAGSNISKLVSSKLCAIQEYVNNYVDYIGVIVLNLGLKL